MRKSALFGVFLSVSAWAVGPEYRTGENGHYNGKWSIGHWDGPLDGFWIGVYAPKWWDAGFTRFTVDWKNGGWEWRKTAAKECDLVDQLEMSCEGERAAHDELLETWIDPRCYGQGGAKK